MLKKLSLKNKLILIVLVPVILLCFVIFFLILPAMRASLYEEKRQQVKALVDSGITIIQYYHSLERSGELSRDQAQENAMNTLRSVRFGERAEDYFWINDSRPYMVMHPIRRDLEGTDVSGLRDPDGLAFMIEFVNIVRAEGSGYVRYRWQYYDDASRIELKESYVRGFEPWDWILGTGVYIDDVETLVASQRNTVILFLLATLIIVGLLAFTFINDIVGSVNTVISNMTRNADQMLSSSEQVSTASMQVSASSQSMAEGVSEQASSIEETSASMEEMSSMAKQNADNANEAKILMIEAKNVVQSADSAMKEMTGSMSEIARASDDTSKIIKTIDEIAFQTNLLALNAAVEAARAGEAGAGFAVVADEVRNLAMRAAEAAKNTAVLIEGTLKKVKDGQALVNKTNEIFGKVAVSASKVAELIEEISAASAEQNTGSEQVNKAVNELEKVTQQNAANSEESAAAAQELNSQAAEMKNQSYEIKKIIEQLRGVIFGIDAQITIQKTPSQSNPSEKRPPSLPPKTKSLTVQSKKVNPSEIIPFDDDLSDF